MSYSCVDDPKRFAVDPEQFVELYQMICRTVPLIDEGKMADKRAEPPWMRKKITRSKCERAIKNGAVYLPFNYQDQYVLPLLANLDLVLAQSKDSSMLENIIGAVFDQSEESTVANEVHQLVAVISNLYRTFLRAPEGKNLKIQLRYVMPPLGTFQYKVTLDDCTPSILPVDEVRLLFGGLVGVLILPDTFRKFPALWSATVHEVGGHDLLRAHSGILRDLEEGMERLFVCQRGLSRATKTFLALLWKYWIGEAAADIAGILNMGPSYALSVALYTAVLNKQLIPAIKNIVKKQGGPMTQATLESLDRTEHEMKTRPRLNTSPPPPMRNQEGEVILDDLDTHPTDVLRMYVMEGAIEGLRDLNWGCKNTYLKSIDDVLKVCLTDRNNKPRQGSDKCNIAGYIQTGPDTWISRRREFGLNLMRSCAKEVGRFVVTEKFDTLTRTDETKQSMQDLVAWTNDREEIVWQIARRLLEVNGEGKGLISNSGDDAQLLAGATLALFKNPGEEFFKNVNSRLAEAFQTSFDRDEVWGYPVLSRQWSPFSGPSASSSRAIVK